MNLHQHRFDGVPVSDRPKIVHVVDRSYRAHPDHPDQWQRAFEQHDGEICWLVVRPTESAMLEEIVRLHVEVEDLRVPRCSPATRASARTSCASAVATDARTRTRPPPMAR